MYEDIIKTAAAKGHGLGSDQLEPIIATAISLAITQTTTPVALVSPIQKDPELVRQLDAANKEIANLRHELNQAKTFIANQPPLPLLKGTPEPKTTPKSKPSKPKHRY
jgi:hypothetical protein